MTLRLALLPLVFGCSPNVGGGDSAGGATDVCGDIDGDGGDSGDVPNILGKWTVSFGTHVYDTSMCDIEGMEADDMNWINGYMDVGGRVPDMLVAHFDGDEDEDFWGIENSRGGVVFTGMHERKGHIIYVSVGGLLYDVPQVERSEIRGFGYMGVDKDGADTVIDCWLQGDFVAKKSGN